MMPLKLIERVLPWLVGSLKEDEARDFLKNMQLAGLLIFLICLFFSRDKPMKLLLQLSIIFFLLMILIFLVVLIAYSSLNQLQLKILLW